MRQVLRFRTRNTYLSISDSGMLVHSACSGELFIHGDFIYCNICEREIGREEILVIDDNRSPRSR
jgi:hypothetical protein